MVTVAPQVCTVTINVPHTSHYSNITHKYCKVSNLLVSFTIILCCAKIRLHGKEVVFNEGM